MDSLLMAPIWLAGIVINVGILTNKIQGYPKPMAVVLLCMCMLPIIVPIINAIIKLIKKIKIIVKLEK